MNNKTLDEQSWVDEKLDTYLADSPYFEDFFRNAEADIAEHLLEISGGKEPFSDEVRSYAREIWEEYVDGQLPY